MGYGFGSGVRHALVLRQEAETPYGAEAGTPISADRGRDLSRDADGDRARVEAGGDARTPATDDADAAGAEPTPTDPFAPFSWSDPDASDADALVELGNSIATIAAHLHAGMHVYLTRLARFDRLEGWRIAGHRTCAYWLAYRTKCDLATAREHVRVARALEKLPETGASMGRGALSYSQVRALTRVARPETEGDLLEIAEKCTAAQLEGVVRAWKKDRRLDEEERERLRYESRTLSITPDGDGMYDVRGKLTAADAHLLMRGVDAASDAIFREEKRTPLPPIERERRAAQRRADALVLLSERGLAAGFGADDPKTLSGTRAERYQVFLHVEAETLTCDEEPGMSELEDGTRVSAETSRRVACDCAVVRVTRRTGEHGRVEILDVGRRERTVSTPLRRALELRDRGCRFPGCGLRFTDAHHVIHWADGGETDLDNTALLCDYHHRLVHEGGWEAEWWGPGRSLAFRDRRGQVHVGLPPKNPEVVGDPMEILVRSNRARGVEPDEWTAGARWRSERDIPDEVLFRAIEAAL